MARILVLFATRYGSTAGIAARISDVLRSHGHEVSLVDIKDGASSGDLDAYNGACVAAAVYSFRRYPRSIVRFARRNRSWLEHTSSVFVSVGLVIAGGGNGQDEAQVAVDRFMARTGWRPARIEFVSGALPYSRYDVMTRRAMRRASARWGGATDVTRDYTYTDWDQLDRFANELATVFERPTVPSDGGMPNKGIQQNARR